MLVDRKRREYRTIMIIQVRSDQSLLAQKIQTTTRMTHRKKIEINKLIDIENFWCYTATHIEIYYRNI
jgi:hypothetical protein